MEIQDNNQISQNPKRKYWKFVAGFLGIIISLPGLFFIARFTLFFLQGNGNGHTQSLIVGTLLTMVGFQIIVFGIIADLIGFNRKLLEQIKAKIK